MKKRTARHIFKGRVTAVTEGATITTLKFDLGRGITITSSLTVEAAKELNLKKGDEVYATIKASEVIIEKDRRP